MRLKLIARVAGLQNLFGGNDGSPLAPIVESGAEAYHMPGAREFMEPALNEYISSGKADEAIKSALRMAGFDVL